MDIRILTKRGILDSGQRVGSYSDNGTIWIQAKNGEITVSFKNMRGEDTEDFIKIVRTPLHFGGSRPWFICPCCEKRFAILYGGNSYACRKCHRLKYQSQKTRNAWTGYERMKRIRKRLKAYPTGNVWAPIPPRPKKMKTVTYDRLVREYEVARKSQIRIDAPPSQAWA